MLAATRSQLMDLSGRIISLPSAPGEPSQTPAGQALLREVEALANRLHAFALREEVPTAPELAGLAREGATLQFSAVQLLAVTQAGRSAVPDARMSEIASQYGEDARATSETASRCRRAGTLTWAVAVGLVAVGLLTSYFGDPRVGVTTFFYECLIAAGVVALAAVSMQVLAERSRRSAEDMLRVQRHLLTVQPYLSPLPDGVQTLMRATLAPRLFSQASGEEDPTQAPLWPTADQILRSDDAHSASEGHPEPTPRRRLFARNRNPV